MKKTNSTFTVIIANKNTGAIVSENKTESQNKMWTLCRETLRADEKMELKVDVIKDGELFKSFTRVVRNGKREWWMHNAIKATNRKWQLKMEREAKAKQAAEEAQAVPETKDPVVMKIQEPVQPTATKEAPEKEKKQAEA